MKFAISVIFAVGLIALATADLDRGFVDCGEANLDGFPCRLEGKDTESQDLVKVTKTEVVYHTGKHGDHAADIKAGDQLNDKIAEIQLAFESSHGEDQREILLKCKVPGCTFNLASAVKITASFKIRGELKHGKKPVIVITSPFTIDLGLKNAPPVAAPARECMRVPLQKMHKNKKKGGGGDPPIRMPTFYGLDFELESVVVTNGGKTSQGHFVISGEHGSSGSMGESCGVTFKSVTFKGLNTGFTNGGAIEIKDSALCGVDILSSSFVGCTAKNGGAIAAEGSPVLSILDTKFVGNAAIEEGGAIWIQGDFAPTCVKSDLGDQIEFAGVSFKDNTANKKGDTFVGRGGAIYAENTSLLIRDARTHGGNTAKFGNLIYLDATCLGLNRFGCYEGPFNHVLNGDGYEGYGEYYSAYPTCTASSYDTYALKEDIYARENSSAFIQGVDLPGGVTCEERGTASTVTRHGCGSHIYAYHCLYGDDDHYVEAEDYDRDGFDCRYDCNDVWETVNPAAGEQCNFTSISGAGLNSVRNMQSIIYQAVGKNGKQPMGPPFVVRGGLPLDSNCNGLVNEWKDTDGDHVPDWYDQCPHDYWKISPGKCGCGYEDTEGCVQAGGSGECTTVEDGGVWYYMCEGNWWYWGDNDWTYGGAY